MKTTRLRVTLRDVAPPVVRVLDVPSVATLSEIHQLLQAGMGWTNSHLHLFEAGDIRYGLLDPDFAEDDSTLCDENAATLSDLPGTFDYRYDFGDGWEHHVERLGPGSDEPGCIDGEGACPPEDCGGAPGYAEFREALADPTHPAHERLRSWGAGWTDSFDQPGTDELIRDTVGQVPGSVRLLLRLLDGGVRLTPGGRLPRVLVRAVQGERPTWSALGQLASIEEDLPPLAVLHDVLRQAGLVRLTRGVLTPTKAASQDLQVVRRLRQALEQDSFHDTLFFVTAAQLAASGPANSAELADAVHPWLDRWAIGDRPVTVADIRRELWSTAPLFRALDLVEAGTGLDAEVWRAGPSATSLHPRATALAHCLRRAAGTVGA